jgi:hypothetical protein
VTTFLACARLCCLISTADCTESKTYGLQHETCFTLGYKKQHFGLLILNNKSLHFITYVQFIPISVNPQGFLNQLCCIKRLKVCTVYALQADFKSAPLKLIITDNERKHVISMN